MSEPMLPTDLAWPDQAAGPHAPYPPAGWATPQTSTTAIVAMVLAAVSFLGVLLIPAIVALILCRNADEEIAASGGRVTGSGLVLAARITAWANVAFCAVLALGLLALVLAAGALF